LAEILKGNFKPAKPISIEAKTETLEERFEREAMKQLGGSMAFVSKKKVKWDPETP
jgi:hypothetical protein